jgi:hypothetical protein
MQETKIYRLTITTFDGSDTTFTVEMENTEFTDCVELEPEDVLLIHKHTESYLKRLGVL